MQEHLSRYFGALDQAKTETHDKMFSFDLDLSLLKSHAFFEGISVDALSLLSTDVCIITKIEFVNRRLQTKTFHVQQGPVFSSGAVAPAPDAKWYINLFRKVFCAASEHA